MKKEVFSKQLVTAMQRKFPQSRDSAYSYRYDAFVQSEGSRPFEKVAIVIDSDMNREDAEYIFTALCSILCKRPFVKSARYILAVWNGDSLTCQPACANNMLKSKFEQISLTSTGTAAFDVLCPALSHLYHISEWTIFITSISKFRNLGKFHYSARSYVVYADREHSNVPQKLLRTLCFGLDVPTLESESALENAIEE